MEIAFNTGDYQQNVFLCQQNSDNKIRQYFFSIVYLTCFYLLLPFFYTSKMVEAQGRQNINNSTLLRLMAIRFKGSRKNKFTFWHLIFSSFLADIEEQKARNSSLLQPAQLNELVFNLIGAPFALQDLPNLS